MPQGAPTGCGDTDAVWHARIKSGPSEPPSLGYRDEPPAVRAVRVDKCTGRADQGEKALQPHKGANNTGSNRIGDSDTANANATDVDDKTNSGGDTATIAHIRRVRLGHQQPRNHVVSSFAGYLYWGTGWDSAVQGASNRLVRVGALATEGMNLYCDGKLVNMSSVVGPLPVFSCSCSRPYRLCSTHWV
jgi:hypothetical protein